MIDATTLTLVDSFPSDIAMSAGAFISPDESTLYYDIFDQATSQPYLIAYSISTKSIQWQRRMFDIGPPTDVKLLVTGRRGKCLINYAYPTGDVSDNHYLVYDPVSGGVSVASSFPFREEATLSPNGTQIIASRVEIQTTGYPRGDVKTGDVWIFDAASGIPQQKLKFPAGGNVYVFDSDTVHFYYHVNATDVWIKAGLSPEPAVKGGIFNLLGTNTLSVRAKPSVSFTNSDTLRGLVVTLCWQARYPLSLGIVSSPTYGITKLDTVMSVGGFKYQKFVLNSVVPISWSANTEYELFTVPVVGSAGVEDFTLTNALSGGHWVVDIDYLDKTDSVFYNAVTTCTGITSQNKADNAAPTAFNGARHIAKTSTKLHEVYYSGGQIVYRRKDLSGSWEVTQRISADSDTSLNDPSMIVAHDGSLHVVWQQRLSSTSYNAWYSRSTDGGTTWSARSALAQNIPIITSQWNVYPVIAEYGTTQLVVVWCTGNPNNGITGLQYTISKNLGQSWGTVTGLSSGGQVVWYPSLAAASNFLILTYDGRYNGVFSRIYNGTWQSEQLVSSGDGMNNNIYSSVAVDPQNRPLAAWCANSYSHNEFTIMYRSGNTDGSWGSGFVQFAVDAPSVHDLYPSITYVSKAGLYGIDIVYTSTANAIKVEKYTGDWMPPVSLSTSGQWPNTSLANQTTSPGYPIRVWSDQNGSPYQVVLQSDGNYSFQKAQAPSTPVADLHRRIVVEGQRSGSTIWFDLAPLRIVTSGNDTVAIPFKTLDLTKPFVATITNAWDYLGTDQITLPANAKSLLIETDVSSYAKQDSLGSKNVNVFTSSSFRIDGIKTSQTVPLLSSQASVSGKKNIDVSSQAGQAITLRMVGAIPAASTEPVAIGVGDVYIARKP